MKIVFDARWIFPQLSGIGTYCRELLAAYGRLNPPHRFLVLFGSADIRDRTLAHSHLQHNPHIETQIVPWPLFSLQNQLFFGSLLKKAAADLYHAPNYLIPLPAFSRKREGPCRLVVTIHDVIPLLFPDHAPRSRKSRLFPLYRWLMHETARRADIILCVSRTARTDCIRTLNIPDAEHGRVRAIWNGVSPLFRPPAGGRIARSPTDSREILYVGRSDPYKNLPALIAAFARAQKEAPFPLLLRIAGPPDPRYPEAHLLAASLGLGHSVHWAGYLTDEELLDAYQRADLVVLPSRYEGFGLPVAEAMACGTPVLCGPAPALREIAGNAALYGDPSDTADFARLLLKPLLDPQLAERMSSAGLRQAAAFHWDRTASATLEAYESACSAQENPE